MITLAGNQKDLSALGGYVVKYRPLEGISVQISGARL